jgi:ATP-dependent protease ClpP protease subunit
MSTFKIAEYATGTWFTIAGKATMNTPLTAACSRGICMNNGTFLLVDAQSTVNGQTSNIQVVAKAAGISKLASFVNNITQ